MKYELERTNDEIDELHNQCADQEEEGGSKYPGMTYEQGIQAALGWLIDSKEDRPLPEE